MTEREVLAQQVAGENYALGIDDNNGRREYEKGRLFPNERKAFDAGWEAARQFYTEAHASIAERMCPSGGRLWTEEQLACFSALTACAVAIRSGKHNVQTESKITGE